MLAVLLVARVVARTTCTRFAAPLTHHPPPPSRAPLHPSLFFGLGDFGVSELFSRNPPIVLWPKGPLRSRNINLVCAQETELSKHHSL